VVIKAPKYRLERDRTIGAERRRSGGEKIITDTGKGKKNRSKRSDQPENVIIMGRHRGQGVAPNELGSKGGGVCADLAGTLNASRGE